MMSLSLSHLLLLFYFTLVSKSACGIAVPSPPSVECKNHGKTCRIYNFQGYWEDRKDCEAGYAAWPKSEAEVVHAVAAAVKIKQKIRVVSGLAHALPKLVCPGREGLIINTQNYASVFPVNKTAMTITVQGGTMMRDVMEEAANQGFAVPAMIYWNGVSAAGVISTGAHGSGLAGKGSGVYEYVVSMRLVVPASPSEGYAKVITLTEEDEDMKAARISLGTLGAISEITFALQPMFKRSVSISVENDTDLETEAERFLRTYEFGDIEWVPSHGKAVYMKKYGVPVDVPGNGENALVTRGFRVIDIETAAYHYELILYYFLTVE
uniref:Putative FAD/FMN-containing dehydrogenas n=1 Tax=Taxus baccata TaxID=25629 RepID=A0A0F7J4C1_TAXBA|nr:putative FAD/FMN-containing dehydrogenas [Taxus baccata]